MNLSKRRAYLALSSIVKHVFWERVLHQLDPVLAGPAHVLESEFPADVGGPDIKVSRISQLARREEAISWACDPGAVSRVGVGGVGSIVSDDVSQPLNVSSSSVHPQLSISPGGSIPLQHDDHDIDDTQDDHDNVDTQDGHDNVDTQDDHDIVDTQDILTL